MKIRACDIRLLHCMGFDYVKLLVNPILFIEDSGVNSSNMWYIDEIVNTVVDEGLAVVVCIHPMPDFKYTYLGNPSDFQSLLGFYEAFAGYLAARWGADELAFQLMTEPFGNYTSWNELQPQMWAAVRRGMPDHTLVLSGDDVGKISALVNVKPVDDDNVVYGFSRYEPFLVNLQGAAWGDGWWPYLGDVPYPSSPEIIAAAMDDILDSVPTQWRDSVRAEAIAYGNERWSKEAQIAQFQSVVDWCNAYGVQAWCGEFGNLDPIQGGSKGGGINAEDRYAYIRDIREVFEESNIGWTYWSYNETFTVLNPETRTPFGYPNYENVDAQMLAALGLPAFGDCEPLECEGEGECMTLLNDPDCTIDDQYTCCGLPESDVTAGLENVAFASRGGVAWASSEHEYDYHKVYALNDGTPTDFGDVFITGGDTWSDDEFIGITFAAATDINMLAIHSQPQFGRPHPPFTTQYTTVPNPDETTPDGDWITICGPESIRAGISCPAEDCGTYCSEWRHVYGFDSVNATGIRLLLPDSGPASYAELEVYATPSIGPGVPVAGIVGLGLISSVLCLSGGMLFVRKRR